jgi:hypothetical protein
MLRASVAEHELFAIRLSAVGRLGWLILSDPRVRFVVSVVHLLRWEPFGSADLLC